MAATRKKRYSSQRKKTQRPRIRVRWILLGMLLFLGFVFLSGPKSILKLYALVQYKHELLQKTEQLKQRSQELDEEIERLKTDSSYIEKIAREKYGLKHKREEVVIIKPQ